MATEKEQPLPAAALLANSYCRKKMKTEGATFLEDVKDHIDEFINTSMEEHKNCFKNTMQKMFGMTKAVALKDSSQSKEEV